MDKIIKILLLVFGVLLVLFFVSKKFKKMEPAPGSKESVSVSTVPAVSRPLFNKKLTPEQIVARYVLEWGPAMGTHPRKDELEMTKALFEYYICRSIQEKSFEPCNALKIKTITPIVGSDVHSYYWRAIDHVGDHCADTSAALQLANAYAFGRLGVEDCEKYLKTMASMEDYANPKFWKTVKFSERTFCKAMVAGWKDGGRDVACARVSARGYIGKIACKLIFPTKSADCLLAENEEDRSDCKYVLSGFQASVANDPDKCGSYLHAGCEYMLKGGPAVCDAVAKRLAELYKRYRNNPSPRTQS